jgi:signal transduction histidine kinase
MKILKIMQKHNDLKNSKESEAAILYLLDHYSNSINTKDLDKTIKDSNNLIKEKFGLKNIIFFSLFQGKLEIHSYINKTDIEVVSSLINENLLIELSKKKELKIKDKTFLASIINKQMLAFFVFIGEIDTPQILKIHNQFISNLIEKEKIINDLLEHSQRSTNIEQNFNNTLSVVSHELRTPLANILGFSELMLNKPVTQEEGFSYLKEIFSAGQRLGGIIDNFLDFAKIKNGNLIDEKNFSAVDLEDLCFKAWRYSVKPNDVVEIAWLIDTTLEEIYCDEAAISRVMINLFTNAIKYSQRSQIKIICEIKRTGEKEIRISVKDNGVGIDEKDIKRIFDKFYRSKNADTNFISGSGLGLWICKEIVEAHGGEITCQSVPNQGTQFNIKLKTK